MQRAQTGISAQKRALLPAKDAPSLLPFGTRQDRVIKPPFFRIRVGSTRAGRVNGLRYAAVFLPICANLTLAQPKSSPKMFAPVIQIKAFAWI